jgi:hypothetical protein
MKWKRVIIVAALGCTTVAGGVAAAGGEPRDDAAIRTQLLQQERAVASCMADAGFDYAVEVPKDFLAMQAQAAGHEDQVQSILAQPTENERKVEALRPDRATAFVATVETCKQETWAEVWDPDGELAAVAGRAEELEQQVLADPRMTKARDTWSSCMEQADVEVADPVALLAWLDEQRARGAEGYQALAAKVRSVQLDCQPAYDSVHEQVHREVVDRAWQDERADH